jgi:hypothetical protein
MLTTRKQPAAQSADRLYQQRRKQSQATAQILDVSSKKVRNTLRTNIGNGQHLCQLDVLQSAFNSCLFGFLHLDCSTNLHGRHGAGLFAFKGSEFLAEHPTLRAGGGR